MMQYDAAAMFMNMEDCPHLHLTQLPFFCHFLATVFCSDKDWRMLSCLRPWSCGRNCRPSCKPANSSFLARRFFMVRFCHFFLVGVSPPLRTTRLASLSFSSKPWASFCWIGRRPGICFFHLSLLLHSQLFVFILFFILHFVFFLSHSITFCCIFSHFLSIVLFVYFISIYFFTRSAWPLRLARSLGGVMGTEATNFAKFAWSPRNQWGAWCACVSKKLKYVKQI